MCGSGCGARRRLVGCPVAAHEREPLGARVEPVSAQAAPDPVGRNDDAAPARPRQLGGDPLRTQTGMGEREGDDPLLDERRQLIRHPRLPALARAQHLQSVPVDLPPPGVVGRAMNSEGTARLRDSNPAGQIEQLQPVAEEHVILRHATQLPSSLGGEEASLSCKADSARPRPGAVTLKLLSNSGLSGELGDSPA